MFSFSLLFIFADMMWSGVEALIRGSLGGGQMGEVIDMVKLSGETYKQFWEVINNVFNIVSPFGYALITTYFLIFLFDSAAKEQITVDSLIQLVLIVALVNNLETIVNAMLSFADSMINSFGSGENADFSDFDVAAMVDQWRDEDSLFFAIIESVVIFLLSKIAMIAIFFACISRAIEVGWRIAFSSIGVANCFEGGASSPGIKYLKSLFGSIVAGAALFVVCSAGFAVTAGMLAKDTGNLLKAICALLATAGAAIGASNKAKEIIT